MKVLLAVSGGIDSMYMANKASELFPGASFGIAHCNFSLRDEADADESFVRGWAEAHGMPFHCIRFDTLAYASENGISTEMAARELRYAWFDKLATEHSYDVVAVAHNSNDNAETLMLNLLRGTGIKGACGMDSTRGNIVRPLLGTSRVQIREWMESNGFGWREDATNALNIYKRNIIRNSVFPLFEQINPSFLQTLGSDMEHFREVAGIADSFVKDSGLDPQSIDIGALTGKPHWKYLLYRLSEGRIPESQLKDLERSIESGSQLGGRRFGSMVVSGGRLVPFEDTPEQESMTVHGPGLYEFKGLRLRVETMPAGCLESVITDGTFIVADAAALSFPFLLRGWREGDWMKPFGLKGSKKLSDIFKDLKFGIPEKAASVIIVSPRLDSCADGHVAALFPHRIDNSLKVVKSTSEVLRIRIEE